MPTSVDIERPLSPPRSRHGWPEWEGPPQAAPDGVMYGVVFGCPRSGTTFLMEALEALPRTGCLSGVVYPLSAIQLLDSALPPDVRSILVTEFERSLDVYLRSGEFNSRSAAIRKWAVERGGVAQLRDALQGKRCIDSFIYKEPFLSLVPSLAAESLPGAPIVYIYRDGRDVANSLDRSYRVLTDNRLTDLRSTEMRVGRKVDHRYVPYWVEEGREDEFLSYSPFVRCIWMWEIMVRRCRQYFERSGLVNKGQVLKVKYEELMADPVGVGEGIARHFGAEPTSAYRRRLRRANMDSIGKYHRRDHEELDIAMRLAGEELAIHGYI